MFFPLYDDNPTLRKPLVTQVLIVVNLLVWIGLQGAGLDQSDLDESIEILGLLPSTLFPDDTLGALITFLLLGLTSLFSHASWIHLIGNMWFLWIFGNNVEDSMSRGRFLFLYIASGYAACLAHILMSPPSYIVGASGAVSGISAAYLLLFPKCRIYSALVIIRFVWVFRVPAFILISAHTFIDISSAYISLEDGVAYWAHSGGILFGLLSVRFLVDRDRLSSHPYHGWKVSLPKGQAISTQQKTMLQRLGMISMIALGLGIFFGAKAGL